MKTSVQEEQQKINAFYKIAYSIEIKLQISKEAELEDPEELFNNAKAIYEESYNYSLNMEPSNVKRLEIALSFAKFLKNFSDKESDIQQAEFLISEMIILMNDVEITEDNDKLYKFYLLMISDGAPLLKDYD